ncbi:Crp/Fnr family transcriptional regulator [Enterococcus sp. DIV0242_7C1]|uniref:Cyclic nucleotide-binding domain-containing protein n=1 Tax=Candidatus Enterococcus dunnyi TaxID=1834192 RepID=A0A200J608_9ENTE|nr:MULTISPECIES: Crp/Fnr family transcriptional regulator [unclassified Enterococcus]MBO0471499.1 Crp/Fnr family transcriptional regulator [Enterococcus sp. DIV0242_7C1]OUZ32663.1 hypothetical protein A5889_001372 [Enterococcus sp. 9D6_DIV0238]
MELFKNNQQLIDYLKTTDSMHNITERTLEKGHSIVTEFDKSDHLFFLVDGILSVEVITEANSFISSFIFSNDFFGLDTFSSYQTKGHAISVLSAKATVIKIKKDYLLATLNVHPAYYELLLTNFADIFQRHYRFFDLLSLSPKDRVQTLLSYLADFIGELNDLEQLEIPAVFTQEILAKFCRTSQSRISVCLKELHREGFLIRKKSPFILAQ